AAVGSNSQLRHDLVFASCVSVFETANVIAALNEIDDLSVSDELEARVALRLGGDELQKVPLRHERDERKLVSVRPILDVYYLVAAEPQGHGPHFGVRQVQETLSQPELLQHLERRLVNGVTAKVPEKIAVLLGDKHVAPGSREKQSKHRPRRPTPGDATGNLLFHGALFAYILQATTFFGRSTAGEFGKVPGPVQASVSL